MTARKPKPPGYYGKAARAKRAAARQRRALARLTWSEEKRHKMAAKSARFLAKCAERAARARDLKEVNRLLNHVQRFDTIRRAAGAVLMVRAARFRIEAAA